MSLSITSHPVTTVGINTVNVFPGFKPINIIFSRQDLSITGITTSSGSIKATVGTDLTASLFVGDFIYIYSAGATFTYDASYEVLSISSTEIVLDGSYIEDSTGGYINYKQNYSVEMVLTNPSNFNVDLLGFTLKQTGTDAGIITFDTSIINDLNCQEFVEQLTGREITEGRIKFNTKYREVWREDLTQVFINVNNPIIAIFATETFTIEKFSNPFELPILYGGYPTGIGFIHSDSNNGGEVVKISYDELDINQDDITTNNSSIQFEDEAYGVLLTTTEDTSNIFNVNTKYIRLYAKLVKQTEYDAAEYSSEYSIT
jgi:hypothetical protein